MTKIVYSVPVYEALENMDVEEMELTDHLYHLFKSKYGPITRRGEIPTLRIHSYYSWRYGEFVRVVFESPDVEFFDRDILERVALAVDGAEGVYNEMYIMDDNDDENPSYDDEDDRLEYYNEESNLYRQEDY